MHILIYKNVNIYLTAGFEEIELRSNFDSTRLILAYNSNFEAIAKAPNYRMVWSIYAHLRL